MMQNINLLVVIISVIFLTVSCSVRIQFEKCGTKGFTCSNSTLFPPRIDVVFECSNITTQDALISVWWFNAPTTIASLTIQNCDRLQISFTCTTDNRQIQWLKIKNVGILEILPEANIATPTHNPPAIYFENISYIETIPTNIFSQIKNSPYKGNCFIPINDTDSIYIRDVNIGTIQTQAFNLQQIKKLEWTSVSVKKIETRAINISFQNLNCGELKNCELETVEPLAFLIKGDSFSVTQGKIGTIWTSGFNSSVYDFQFSNNTVNHLHSGAFSILSQNVYITNNKFKRVESGAFRKISPGLLSDSRRWFNNLKFVYFFNNNQVGEMYDNSFRPDILSYKNVNANMLYTYNTLPCSCEGLTWLKDGVNFGSKYNVIKEFNNMLLDPENSNICSFTPCTCFGGTAREKFSYTTTVEPFTNKRPAAISHRMRDIQYIQPQ